jgi:hypothetical protein
MMKPERRADWRPWVALLFALGVASCAAVVSFDEYRARSGATDASVRYAVRGNVSGLDGTKVTILLGNDSLPVVGQLDVIDGDFAFPPLLRAGEHWLVAVRETESHSCSVHQGEGTIAGDVSGVIVSCISKNASLSRLEVSSGTLSPSFSGSTTSYEAHQRSAGLLVPAQATVFATAARPDARITIAGVPLGVSGAVIPLHYGANAVAIDVTAPDQLTRARYALSIVLDARDDALSTPSEVRSVALSSHFLALCFGNFSIPGDVRAYEGTFQFQAMAVGSASWALQTTVSAANAVAMDGGTMVVGRDDGAHVYDRTSNGWSESAVLPERSKTVAIAGQTIAMAGGVDGGLGPTQRVSVYSRTGEGTWSKQASFDFASFFPFSDPHTALALWGDTLAVGTAYEAWDHQRSPNAVFIYNRTGTAWSQEAYLADLSNTAENGFGAAVAVWDNTLAVGDPAGSRLLFYYRGRFNGGSPSWSPASPMPLLNDAGLPSHGGAALAMSSDSAVAVGAPSAPDGAVTTGVPSAGSGAVHVFTRDGPGAAWVQELYLHAPKTKNGGGFGAAVALSGFTYLGSDKFAGRLLVAEPGTRTVYGY